MARLIEYLNTDLELAGGRSLEELAAILAEKGMFPLHSEPRENGRWHAALETEETFTDPESNIVAMLAVIDALDPQAQALWSFCTLREFDIGYECGDSPWAFNQALTAATLTRIAAHGVSLRITLHPAFDQAS